METQERGALAKEVGRMCRWLAYSGSPVLLEELLYKPRHSLVMQSRHSDLGATTVNGDGFGLGWYGTGGTPGLFHSTEPAWNDHNLRELSAQVSSARFFAHVRAATGAPVQQTNCHPFRHGSWLWMHNGEVAVFPAIKRDLMLAIDPDLYPLILGSTDSEVLFFLALTFGLAEDPLAAVARTVGFVETTARSRGIPDPVQMTVATTDGTTTWAFRYSSSGRSRTLFHSDDVTTLRHQYPDNPVLHELSADARLIVSEPLGDLRGAWREVPESTCVVVRDGEERLVPFRP
jgi:glutamine amidotransferase